MQDTTTQPSPERMPPDDPGGPEAERMLQHLAAIVEGSDDAILTKDLNGIITSWNRGAERLFGYAAHEAVGSPVTMLIPPDRAGEEAGILARLRRGERIDHYETIRQRKDGSLIHISLTVSPLRDRDGTIFGASKIARDITDRHRAEERQRLLLGEMQHRIKNVFTLANGLVGLCARRADTPEDLARQVQARLQALAQAHALTVPAADAGHAQGGHASLHSLLRTLCAPFTAGAEDRLILHGDDLPLSGRAVTPLALVLHELATNASKYGALGAGGGTVTVAARRQGGRLAILWSERLPFPASTAPAEEGFGSQLIRLTVEGQLDGSLKRDWTDRGLEVTLDLGQSRLE